MKQTDCKRVYVNLSEQTAKDIVQANPDRALTARPMPKDPVTGEVISRDVNGLPAWEIVESRPHLYLVKRAKFPARAGPEEKLGEVL